jgi:hypothetical protein
MTKNETKKLNKKKFFRKRLRFETNNLRLIKRMQSKLSSQNCKKREMMKKSELMLNLWEFNQWSKTRCIQKT